MSQRWIGKGAQSGLLTRTAATETRFVVRADEKLSAFVEPEIGGSGRGKLLGCIASVRLCRALSYKIRDNHDHYD